MAWRFLRGNATTRVERSAWGRSACRGGRALAAADCLCSFWRWDAFHRHQFRQEKHNRHVRVFSHCKYFLSCQLPSLPALARFLPFFSPSPSLQSSQSGRCASLSHGRCSQTARSPVAPVLSLLAKKATCGSVNTANKQPGPLYCKPVSNEQARVRASVRLNPEYLLPSSPLQAALLSYLLFVSWKPELILGRREEYIYFQIAVLEFS